MSSTFASLPVHSHGSTMSAGTSRNTTPALRDIPRRPSPWHDISHSLSSTSLSFSSRRSSGDSPTTPNELKTGSLGFAAHSAGAAGISEGDGIGSRGRSYRGTPPESVYLLPTPPQSSYILSRRSSNGINGKDKDAFIDGAARAIKSPDIDMTPGLPRTSNGTDDVLRPLTPDSTPTSQNTNSARPRLSAERDHAGHIEYKLKLIDPSPDRLERLVTQMLWRLKEGRGEAIYEIGLAGESSMLKSFLPSHPLQSIQCEEMKRITAAR